MNNNNAIITLVVVLLVLGGFLYFANRDDGTGTPSPSPTSTVESGTPGAGDYDDTPGTSTSSGATLPAAQSARTVLAARLGMSPGDIRIVSAEPEQWPDGCLGLVKAGEMCTQAIVDGYRVTLEANGQNYVYRTNEFGTSARLEQ